MILETFETADDTARAAAALLVSRINAFEPGMHRKFVLGLAGSEALVPAYEAIKGCCVRGQVSFEHVIVLVLTETYGLSSDDPGSRAVFMEDHLFGQIDLPPAQIHLLPGRSPDPSYECAHFESLITRLGGVHLVLADLGSEGRIAANGPGSGLASRTRVVRIPTPIVNTDGMDIESGGLGGLGLGESGETVSLALTVGLGTVFDAGEICLLALGQRVAPALQKTVEGGVTHAVPASGAQMHPETTILGDKESASLLAPSTLISLAPLSLLPPTFPSYPQHLDSASSPDETDVLLSPVVVQKQLHRKPGLRVITSLHPERIVPASPNADVHFHALGGVRPPMDCGKTLVTPLPLPTGVWDEMED